jgi:methylenetetrahydrofolate reductase (NADPH)
MIDDRRQLTSIIGRLSEAGVAQVFVIGGDPEPIGAFPDALSLLREMAELGHHFAEVGVAGYPEGHPVIPDEHLSEAIQAKSPFASYIVTQMCFSSTAIVEWVSALRGHGIDLPVRVGVPGAVEPTRLLAVAGRIGVGDSRRFLSKNRGLLRLLRPGYRAEGLIADLAESGDGLGLDGIHLFTFNQVASTAAWHAHALAVASMEDRSP